MIHAIGVHSAALLSGMHMREHVHASPHVCVVVRGAFEEKAPGERIVCRADTVRVSRPGTPHNIHALADITHCTIVEFDPELYAPYATRLEGSMFMRSREIARLCQSLHFHARHDPLTAECVLLEVLARALRWRLLGRDGDPPQWLRRVRERVDEEFHLRIGLGTLSRDAGVHRSHLARAFLGHFGVTVGEYVRRKRIARARHAIQYTDMPLSRVALDVGFCDQAHMTREVSRTFCITPARLRAIFRKTHGNATPVQDPPGHRW